MINALLDPKIQKFILTNESADPFALSIKYKDINGVPFRQIAEQIISRKAAKSKLPEWYSTQGILYPPKLSLEQCSTAITANYKASLVKGSKFIDLTGGMGVDTLAFSKQFDTGVYVEQNVELTELANHNLSAIGASNLSYVNSQAESFIKDLEEKVDCIYLDPARRGKRDEKVFLFSDCEPDVTKLLPQLLQKAKTVLIKASPMLDIDLSLKSLGQVNEVHVVSVDNECKEVLYLIDDSEPTETKIVTINFRTSDIEKFDFLKSDEARAQIIFGEPKLYLYEPNASIMKAGAFKIIAQRFGLEKLHLHTHLYTTDQPCREFPGRSFEVLATIPYNKKLIKKQIPEGKANITTRNFKEDVNQIRKKTGLKDGGSKYIFACTDMENKPIIIITEKVNRNG